MRERGPVFAQGESSQPLGSGSCVTHVRSVLTDDKGAQKRRHRRQKKESKTIFLCIEHKRAGERSKRDAGKRSGKREIRSIAPRSGSGRKVRGGGGVRLMTRRVRNILKEFSFVLEMYTIRKDNTGWWNKPGRKRKKNVGR